MKIWHWNKICFSCTELSQFYQWKTNQLQCLRLFVILEVIALAAVISGYTMTGETPLSSCNAATPWLNFVLALLWHIPNKVGHSAIHLLGCGKLHVILSHVQWYIHCIFGWIYSTCFLQLKIETQVSKNSMCMREEESDQGRCLFLLHLSICNMLII